MTSLKIKMSRFEPCVVFATLLLSTSIPAPDVSSDGLLESGEGACSVSASLPQMVQTEAIKLTARVEEIEFLRKDFEVRKKESWMAEEFKKLYQNMEHTNGSTTKLLKKAAVAVKHDPLALQYLHNYVTNYDDTRALYEKVAKIAVKGNIRALQYVDVDFKGYFDVAKVALEKDIHALEFVSRSMEQVMADKNLKDEELVMLTEKYFAIAEKAVEGHGPAIRYASSELKDDVAFIGLALKNWKGDASEDKATWEQALLRQQQSSDSSSKYSVWKAIKDSNGNIVEAFSRAWESDNKSVTSAWRNEEFARRAVKKNFRAISCVDQEIKYYYDIAKMAAKEHAEEALALVRGDFLKPKEYSAVVKTALRYPNSDRDPRATKILEQTLQVIDRQQKHLETEQQRAKELKIELNSLKTTSAKQVEELEDELKKLREAKLRLETAFDAFATTKKARHAKTHMKLRQKQQDIDKCDKYIELKKARHAKTHIKLREITQALSQAREEKVKLEKEKNKYAIIAMSAFGLLVAVFIFSTFKYYFL